jgi:hypothetical protein
MHVGIGVGCQIALFDSGEALPTGHDNGCQTALLTKVLLTTLNRDGGQMWGILSVIDCWRVFFRSHMFSESLRKVLHALHFCVFPCHNPGGCCQAVPDQPLCLGVAWWLRGFVDHAHLGMTELLCWDMLLHCTQGKKPWASPLLAPILRCGAGEW